MKTNTVKALITGLCIFTVKGFSVDDRTYDPACTSFSHTCSHKYVSGQGKCPTAPAAPTLCTGQVEANCPGTGNTFYHVLFDFPLSADLDDPTTTCTDTDPATSGAPSYTTWSAHSYITSVTADCYATAVCEWSTAENKCTVKSQGAMHSESKKSNTTCP
jgi:hypothetical protein